MANSTERGPGRFRLAMDNGEVVEVDGSTLVDEDSGQAVPAVILRLPAWRAHALGHVRASWNAAVDLLEDVQRGSMDEGDLAGRCTRRRARPMTRERGRRRSVRRRRC